MERDQRSSIERTRIRNEAGTAYYALCDRARCLPYGGKGEAKRIIERLRRFGDDTPDKEVRRILKAYDTAPHVHAFATMHTFGVPCELGNHHPGCCPGNCWEAGVLEG